MPLVRPRRSGFRGAAVIALMAATQAQADPSVPAGVPVEDAIAAYVAEGLRVLYSTDLVKPWMRVETRPTRPDPAAALDEILAPHGLVTAAGANGTILIVRDPAAPAPSPPARPAAPTPTPVERPPQPGRLLEEIVVSTSRYPLRNRFGGSPLVVTSTDIEYLPEIGEDALRPIGRLPGVASNGLSGRAHVRGGEIGETLVRFDGLYLYDPYHLKDFQSVFSALDPRIVDSIDVYTGGFPAQFGQRMSGVIDVDTMSAPEPRYHEVGVSFFNTSILSAGRVADDRGQWLFSARRSNLDVMYDTFSKQPERPRYLDVFSKLSYETTDALTITGNVLFSHDDISLADDIDREERAQADHEDRYVWLTLDHALPSGASGRTLVSHTALASTRTGTSEKTGISTGTLSDFRRFTIDSLQSDWTLPISDDLIVELGAIVSRLEGRYDYADDVDFDLLFAVDGAGTQGSRTRRLAVQFGGRHYGMYATLRQGLTERLTADFGLRWDRHTLDPGDHGTLGPRIGLRLEIGERTELRAGIGRFHQSQTINELQVSDGVVDFYAPQRSDHTVLGFHHEFPRGLGLRLELYSKKMTELRPRYENLLNDRVLLPELKPDRIRVAPDEARSRGVEVMLDGQRGDGFRWWLAYTWSRVEDRIGQTTVLRGWDQPHALDAGFNFDTTRWNVGLSGAFHSGWPTTALALDDSGALPLATVESRNAERLGNHASIDLLVTRKVALRRSRVAISFELLNVLGRDNPCCIEFEIGDEDEAGLLLTKELTYLERIPSIGFLWTF